MQSVRSQDYYPFPTDNTKWNCLFWHQWSPNDINLTNSQYLLQGDTILKSKTYSKVYSKQTDVSSDLQYLGGLREDLSRNIYFFPSSSTMGNFNFQQDTSESLLYTFNNLEIGMILPINQGNATIKVNGIDSVLLGSHYRKRYEIQNSNLLFYPEFWIEGIGSTKDLLSPFTYEFEWKYYTLCFEDTVAYYINTPDGTDSCHYSLSIGIPENRNTELSISPNPAGNYINIQTTLQGKTAWLTFYNSQGRLVQKMIVNADKSTMDISQLAPGIYFVRLQNHNKTISCTILKE